MRAFLYAVVAAMCVAPHPASAQNDPAAAKFWKTAQGTCDATTAKAPSELGQRIGQTAIDAFTRFGGHKIDSDGRLFHFGLTEAEHEEDDGGDPNVPLGQLGWWQVMKYWRALFGDDTTTSKLEVRGYRDASTSTQDAQQAELLRTSAAELLRLADSVSDPDLREILRETAMRAAIVDTSWSAAFISYVIKQAGVAPNVFQFANAHRVYIYDAFAVSAAEVKNETREGIYRACPPSTVPRGGDLICQQREAALADDSDEAVRERIRSEIGSDPSARSVRRTHCEVVAHVDKSAHKVYTIGGNVNQAVTARKMNLRRNMRFSTQQKGNCGGPGHWTLPQSDAVTPHPLQHADRCSLNDRKWFVLLQLR